jgi:phosphatidylserine decarboxylase
MITPYGGSTPYKYFAVALLCFVTGYAVMTPLLPATIFLWLFGLFLVVFTLNFFRDPERKTTATANQIVSAADGKVVVVKSVATHPVFPDGAVQISVFMSPLNVHVNRNPITGKVVQCKYIEGLYLVAFDDASGEKNERTEILMENDNVKVFFKQISGYVARRIVCPLKAGDAVTVGERFGMIKFGSRVDMFLPKSVKVLVKEGDLATAGETVLAEVPQT